MKSRELDGKLTTGKGKTVNWRRSLICDAYIVGQLVQIGTELV